MAAALQQSPAALQGRSRALRRSPTPISAVARFLPLYSSSIATLPLRLPRGQSLPLPRRRRGRAGGATMMDTAASRYAAALADVANSNCTLDATIVDMEKVAKVFADGAVYNYFTNPTVDPEKKRCLVDDIVKVYCLQAHTANFLNILVDMKRTELVKDIVEEFEACYNKITGTEVALVTSVVPLDSHHLTQIAKSVQRRTGAKNVRVKTKLDPSLVAGFTIRYGSSGSKFIDMSVRKQLDEIAKQLDFSNVVGSLVS